MKRDEYLLHLFPLSALQLIAAIEELKHNAMERVTWSEIYLIIGGTLVLQPRT